MKYALIFLLMMMMSTAFAQNKEHEWVGTASYYHSKFHGRKTSSGEPFDQKKLTAAHNFLPLGTKVKVTNLKNNKTVVVTINDRMSARNKRLIDLSAEAAKALGFYGRGLCKVRIELLESTTVVSSSRITSRKRAQHKKKSKRLNKR